MSQDYEPYNSKYCKEIDCPQRHGNKCLVEKCIHAKEIRWWTQYKEPK